MIYIEGRNVNLTFHQAVDVMAENGVVDTSRNGDVRAAPCPVMTCTLNPTERVLFNRHRDANPFFHFFECLWMMSGSDDGKLLDVYVKDFSARFGEPEDGAIWGAYGQRWREHFGIDQLSVTVDLLRKNHQDRRVVISMWDTGIDVQSEEVTNSGLPARDVPCNTQIYPRIVNGCLDITVTCRSNDVVWGCYGANAVHFSFLQEYLAARIGVPVGRMYQLSNNWHLYENTSSKFVQDEIRRYPRTYPIVQVPEKWDADNLAFAEDPECAPGLANTFFADVALQMKLTHRSWSRGDKDSAMDVSHSIAAEDWRIAIQEWMERRMKP